MDKTKINQSRGPTTGNAGNTAKRSAFTADKKAKAGVASEIARAVGALAGKPAVPKTSREKNQGAVMGDVNKGRGPTKGNK
jgi:hypothetical protein